jgi:hypothetical protein
MNSVPLTQQTFVAQLTDRIDSIVKFRLEMVQNLLQPSIYVSYNALVKSNFYEHYHQAISNTIINKISNYCNDKHYTSAYQKLLNIMLEL